MYITQKALPRRTFLRAMGTAVALPMLDAMVPALTAAPKPIQRFGFVYIANGVIQDQWRPATTGSGFALPPILEPFAPVRNQINVLTGLSHLQADTFGDGTGDHPRASAVWLTGVHAYDRTKPGVEVRLATTVDQMIARTIGRTSRIPSLEMAVDFPTQGACDSGDCFYVNTVSWRNETTPNPTESHPRVVFERLFGDGGSAATRQARQRSAASLLDSVRGEASRLAGTLGAGDTAKLGEYLDSIREIEQRIQHTETQPIEIELPERPLDIPAAFDVHTRLMFDLQALAFRADITRVFSLIMSRELSSRTFASIGVPEQHHAVSHHRNDPQLIAKKAKIDLLQAQLTAYFLEALQRAPDGDGTLLDHSLVLYGGGMGDGNLHRHSDLPCLMAGGLGGAFKTGRHLKYALDTPMTNLLLTILDAAGVPLDRLGDSTGRLPLDPLVRVGVASHRTRHARAPRHGAATSTFSHTYAQRQRVVTHMLNAHEALVRLREGNERFAANQADERVLSNPARRAELVAGQEPFAIILGCSDSRVPAELVFDQGFGDLFVIRVAGNIVAPSQVGSVEFAASRYGTRLVVVMGHSQCGAVLATLDELQGRSANESRNLRSIVERVRPSVETVLASRPLKDPDTLVHEAVRANVRASADHLRHGSELLEQLIHSDGLLVVGAEYSLETGVVDFFDGVADAAVRQSRV